MLVAAGDGMVLCWRRGATLQEPSTFMAIDAATGDARWAIPLGAPGGRPAWIAAGRVHLGPGGAPLRTLDAATAGRLTLSGPRRRP